MLERRPIPRTELAITKLAFGGWLTLGSGSPEEESQRMLARAVDAGINHLDLADVYGHGEAERVVGRFLKGRDRDQLVLSSKLYFPMSEDPKDQGLGRAHIAASVDASLSRLGTEHLDLYYCHREDPGTPLAETAEAMNELVVAGKIRAWGTSTWRPKTLRRVHALCRQNGWAPPVIEQPCYNLSVRWLEESVLPTLAKLDMACIAFSPLAGGNLTGKYLEGTPPGSRAETTGHVDRRPELVQRVRRFVELARAHAVAPEVLALAWVLAQPGLTSAIIGARTLEQLEANLPAASFTPSEELRSALDDIFPPGARPLWYVLLKRLLGRA